MKASAIKRDCKSPYSAPANCKFAGTKRLHSSRYGFLWLFLLLISPISLYSNNINVKFSHSGGFYDQSFELSLTCPDGYSIHYTTNGNEPNWTDPQYQSPLWIDEKLFSDAKIYTIQTCKDEWWREPDTIKRNVVIRAAAFDNKGNRISEIGTHSYFIKTLGNDTHGLPVISICTDSLSLFDHDTGLFVPGASGQNYNQKGRDWERRCNFEFYEFDNSGVNQQVGLRTHGGISRTYLQKGMKVYARKEYGKGRFYHKFFNTTDKNNFKNLVLKPMANMHVKDYICSMIANRLNFESPESRPVVVYINGEYWGLYYLKERPNDRYIADYYGYDKDDINIIEHWDGHAADGNNKNFLNLMQWLKKADLTDDAQYDSICKLIDIDCFIDYYCFQLYIENDDWPHNNMRCWQNGNGKWRWISFDCDLCFDNPNMLSKVIFNLENQDISTVLFSKLLSNANFRDQFYKRHGELIINELSYNSIHPYIVENLEATQGEIASHCKRFVCSRNPDDYEQYMNSIDQFFSFRTINSAAMIYQLYYHNNWTYRLSNSKKQAQFKFTPNSKRPTFLLRMARQFGDWSYVKLYFSYERIKFRERISASKFVQYLKKKRNRH